MFKSSQINFHINGQKWRSQKGCSIHNTFFYKVNHENICIYRYELLQLEGSLQERLLEFKRFKIRCMHQINSYSSTYTYAEVDKILEDLNVKNDLSKRDL